jgi:hypothetical protein
VIGEDFNRVFLALEKMSIFVEYKYYGVEFFIVSGTVHLLWSEGV